MPGEIWVNLYQPSELRATLAGTPVRLTQTTEYPFDPQIRIALQPSRPTAFTLRLRIPAWADSATLAINGTSHPIAVQQGFTAITRTWRANDSVSLTLPLSLRLEPLAANGGASHPNLVALLYGPVVLFALHEAENMTVPVVPSVSYPPEATPQPAPIAVAREALLAARRSAAREWTVAAADQSLRFVPFTDLADRRYTTYLSAI